MLLQNQMPLVYDQTVEVIFTVYISPCMDIRQTRPLHQSKLNRYIMMLFSSSWGARAKMDPQGNQFKCRQESEEGPFLGALH